MSWAGKILVLGAAGQLGNSLLQVLGAAQVPVEGWDRKALDIADSRGVAARIAKAKPWAVINAAAWTDVDGCEKDVEKAYTVNAIAAGEVAAAAAACGARIVQLSTDYVFDGFQTTPYREDDEPNPLSIYGKSKLEGERLVLEAAPQALIVRSSWLFGMGRANFVMRIFESVMAQKEINVVEDRRGTPTFTDDLAAAIKNLLEKDATGLVHASNQGECSWYEYAKHIVSVLQINECRITPVKGKDFKRPAPRPDYTVLDNTRYQGLTGERLRPWQEALEDFLTHLNTQLNPSDL